jgi:glyoxylase-like metal-dependent hydrolase (beta-lactamase superfamily II)
MLLSAAACRPTGMPKVTAAELLAGATRVLHLDEAGDRIRVGNATDVASMDYQSDRTYPPYLWSSRQQRVLVGRSQGKVRLEMAVGPMTVFVLNDTGRQAVVSPRGAQFVPRRTPNLTDERAMDVWTVLSDWSGASDLRVAGRCSYRDFDRLVVARGRGPSEERLFIDPRTGYPVKLERREAHALWGDVLAEYTWSIWTPVAGSRALAPQYTFRLVDGEVNQQRHVPRFAFLPADSASLLQFPATITPLTELPPAVPDTVRVGPQTFLLRTPSYTNVVTLQRDTVWVIDAQTDAGRAREDSLWIGRLFPGKHPVVVVVTDLAWPHIAGVRYWVAQGAIVASRDLSRPFLQRVVARDWQLEPDVLTRRRTATPFRFRPIRDGAAFAGGAVRIAPIDGAGSEGALMVYLPGEQFLYTGDFVQPGGPDSFSRVYAEEVAAAAARAGFAPTRYAGMHVPLAEWAQLPRLNGLPERR